MVTDEHAIAAGLRGPTRRSSLRLVLLWLAVGMAWAVACIDLWRALAERGDGYWAKPYRSFRFACADQPLRERHRRHPQIVQPDIAGRLPATWDTLREPALVRIGLTVQPNGSVTSVRVAQSSGIASLDATTLAHVGTWVFEPDVLPAPESVTVTIRNGRHVVGDLGRSVRWLSLYWLISMIVAYSIRRHCEAAVLWTVACGLTGAGWVVVARLAADTAKDPTPEQHAKHMLTAIAVGAIVLLALLRRRGAPGAGALILRLRPRAWRWRLAGIGAPLLLMVTWLTPLGTDNGTGYRLWLRLPGFTLQSVEIAKLLLAAFIAGLGADAMRSLHLVRSTGDRSEVQPIPWWSLRKYGAVLAITLGSVAVLALMRDFGPVMVIWTALLLSLHIQGRRRLAAVLAGIAVCALVVGYLIGQPRMWAERVALWKDPWRAVLGKTLEARAAAGDAAARSQARRMKTVATRKEHQARMIWMASAGSWTGYGFGRGWPDSVDAAASDFTFAVFGEEAGWLGAGALLWLLLRLSWGAFRVGRMQESVSSRLLAGAYGLMLGCQALITAGGNVGLWPFTGLTLPFISSGGTSLLVSFAMLGALSAFGIAPRIRPGGETDITHDTRIRLSRGEDHVRNGILVVGGLVCAQMLWLHVNPSVAATRDHEVFADTVDGARLAAVRNERRTDEPRSAEWVIRGSILDRHGRVIAASSPRGRSYAGGPELAGLVGFDRGRQGRVGLERWLRPVLVGEWPAAVGQAVRRYATGSRGAYDAVLTIDAKLQRLAYDLLDKRGLPGSVVGIDPSTGEILFAADYPAVKLGDRATEEWLRAFDAVTADPPWLFYRRIFAPGSVFKTVVMAAALDADPSLGSKYYQCIGHIAVTPRSKPIKCNAVHGHRTMSSALPPSCNPTFVQAGIDLGWHRLLEFADRAGFNRNISLLPGELRRGDRVWCESAQSYIVPGIAWPEEMDMNEASPDALARTSIGQWDVRMTPLQLACWIAAIAKGGDVVTPTLIRQVRASNRALWVHRPRSLGRCMSPTTADAVTSAMRAVVESADGTGRGLRNSDFSVAAKTGTAQRPGHATDAFCVAFAPVNAPRVAVAVALHGGRSGAEDAVPIAAEMVRAIVRR